MVLPAEVFGFAF